jgi:hypothetical protein
MQISRWVLLVAASVLAGCQSQHSVAGNRSSLTPSQRMVEESSVRGFVSTVAHDVTQDGPSAWRKFFLDSPSFFMASEGRLQFADGQAAAAIQSLTRIIKHIELRWGDDLRVDVLTPDLAVVAAPYSELRIDAEGYQVNEAGYFSGVVQFENGRWQLRNAHWSVVVPPAKVP